MSESLKLINNFEIAQRIKKLIDEKGYTKAEIARKLRISPTSVYKWLEAESIPDVQHLLDLSEMLGVTIDYIVKGGDD